MENLFERFTEKFTAKLGGMVERISTDLYTKFSKEQTLKIAQLKYENAHLSIRDSQKRTQDGGCVIQLVETFHENIIKYQHLVT